MNLEEETSKRWDRLIETGALVPIEDEEDEYVFDIEKLQEVDPELYQVYMDDLDEMLMHLHTQGLIDLDFSGDEVSARVTEKGIEARDALKNLGIY